MKNTLLILTVLYLCAAFNLMAQTEKKALDVEMLAGVNLSNVNKANKRLGYGFVIQRVWFAPSHFNLVAGLSAEKIKTFLDNKVGGHFSSQKDLTINSFVFSVPLLLRYGVGSKPGFYVEAGPHLQYMPFQCFKGTEIKYAVDATSTSSSFSEVEYCNTFGLSVVLAAIAYKLHMHKLPLLISAAYNKGLISDFNFYTDSGILDYFTLKVKSRYCTLI